MNNQTAQGPSTGLTPHIAIPDKRGSEAIDFYTRAFGAAEQNRVIADDGIRLMHAHLIINDGSLMMHDDFPEYTGSAMREPSGFNLHLQIDDTDKWFNRAVEAGATPTMPPEDMFWGDRYAQVKDPFGHTWAFGSPVAKGE